MQDPRERRFKLSSCCFLFNLDKEKLSPFAWTCMWICPFSSELSKSIAIIPTACGWSRVLCTFDCPSQRTDPSHFYTLWGVMEWLLSRASSPNFMRCTTARYSNIIREWLYAPEPGSGSRSNSLTVSCFNHDIWLSVCGCNI